jgi:Uma2 family endonuclease
MVLALDALHVSIPAAARTIDGFRRWCNTSSFPEHGRVDFLAGDLEVDMSPEDLYAHGAVKAEIAARLQHLVSHSELGSVFVDRTRVSEPGVGLSVEPDVVVVMWSSIEAGRVREVPASSGEAGRFVELEGAPDLVVEILSDASMTKDRDRLPPLYSAAGVRELWLVDARGENVLFEIRTLDGAVYRKQLRNETVWQRSEVLALNVRLIRLATPLGRFRYVLEHEPLA